MKAGVIDASVVAAAFFNEEHAPAAKSLLVGRQAKHAPDLIWIELASVIWKRHRRGEIDEEEARQLLADMQRLPLQITPSADLVEPALALAMRTGRSVYDCVYLALAVKHRAAMHTCDERLVNALAGTPLEPHVAWIGRDK